MQEYREMVAVTSGISTPVGAIGGYPVPFLEMKEILRIEYIGIVRLAIYLIRKEHIT